MINKNEKRFIKQYTISTNLFRKNWKKLKLKKFTFLFHFADVTVFGWDRNEVRRGWKYL